MSTAIVGVAVTGVGSGASGIDWLGRDGGRSLDRTVAATEQPADRTGQFTHLGPHLAVGRPGIVTGRRVVTALRP